MHSIKLFNLLFSLILLLRISIISSSHIERSQSYIIHMDKSAIPDIFSDHHSWYLSTLESLSEDDENAPIHLYTYKHVVNGFSAVMSESQLSLLEKLPGHVATQAEQYGQVDTTHTPKFLGLRKDAGLWPTGRFGDDMIIGVLDTGIWPESKSFRDRGMPPVPLRWRGRCENGTDFKSSYCNRKLIGARLFSKALKQQNQTISKPEDYDSPRDNDGHGSHTASTAAGSAVKNVDYFGYAKGTATGIAPFARLAMYKVLFSNRTSVSASSDTLAGIDQAIEDGVDIISISLGFRNRLLYEDPTAVGTFAAMEKGIFVACSAGNRGPNYYTVHNTAPWVTTVSAGTVDREFVAYVTLGDGVTTVKGKSIYPGELVASKVPLYYGHGNTSRQNCESGSLQTMDVTGKFVYCPFSNTSDLIFILNEVYRAGAKGVISATDAVSAGLLTPDDFYIPFVAISPPDGEKVENYLTKNSAATVTVKFKITELGTKPAPKVAKFSSRGPSPRAPGVLKPDIMAPGVDILAAWAPNRGRALSGSSRLFTDYALVSGTSMATPHVAGIAALLKSAHRDWSSAAIRSAMMTTADVVDNSNGTFLDMETETPAISPLDFGSGHVNPNKALDPGLVYDIEVEDYIDFLCALNLTKEQIQVITSRSNYPCDKASLDLNYPSFVVLRDHENDVNSTRYRFKRVLTNVGDSPSVYHAVISAPSGMKVTVDPMSLTFGNKNSKAEFTMEATITATRVTYGYLSWHESNGKHVVRSPIVSAFPPSE